MNNKEQKKIWMEQVLQKDIGLKNLKKNFHCMNPEHDDRNPSMSYDFTRGVVHCFGCGETYDVYDVLKLLYGYSFLESQEYLQGIQIKERPVEKKIGHKNSFSGYIERCYKGITEKTINYLNQRGITTETIHKEKIGHDTYSLQGENMEVVVFPYDLEGTYYIQRSLEGKQFFKPSSEVAGSEPVYHYEKLRTYDVIVVCESVLDCLSVEQESEYAAVALNGTGYEKLLNAVNGMESKTFILCLDDDQAGQKATLRLSEKLRTYGHKVIFKNQYQGYKDANDFLVGNKKSFLKWVSTLESETSDSIFSVKEKSVEDLLKEFNILEQEKSIVQSEWESINKELSWLPGTFVVLGGIPSSGKTSFCLQLSQSFARNQKVIYFSLEQSTQELLKTIYLQSEYLKTNKNRKTNLSNLYIQAKDPQDVLRVLQESHYERGSVVFIDYIQLLSFGNVNQRTANDKAILSLKQLAKERGWIIVGVSSINRSNYLQPIEFESFKESGGIEYTADIVLGLQYQCVHERLFSEDGRINAKRDRLNQQRLAKERPLELVCLKNRNGRVGWGRLLGFVCEHRTFIEWKKDIKKEPLEKRL